MSRYSCEHALDMMDRFDGWFFRDEAKLLYEEVCGAVRRLNGVIVEVGSYCGRSTTVLGYAALAVKVDSIVYAIDPHEGILSSGRVPSTYDRFQQNMKTADLERAVIQIRKRSTEVSLDYKIAVLFIDALHDYRSVSADYAQFAKLVEPGGLVAFHDYSNPDHPDVRRYVDELVKSGELSIHALPKDPRPQASLIILRKAK